MAAIPFSLVGILPAHGLMGAFFTATSMIGFIAGAGIVVRNSIILVDFIELRLKEGMPLDQAVIDADLHEGRGRHLGPMHPEWNLIVAVAAARHDQGQVVEDPLAETLHEGQAMRRRKVDARLPFLGAVIPERFRRNPELHGHPPG